VDHEEFHDPEFVAMVKHLSLSIDIAGFQALYTMEEVGWLLSSHVCHFELS
jgi:hypothetical protein